MPSASHLGIFAAGIHDDTGITMIHDAYEQGFVQWTIRSSNSSVQASILLDSLRKACSNDVLFRFWIFLF